MKLPVAVIAAVASLAVLVAKPAAAGDLVVHLPPGITCQSASALAPSPNPGEDGPATIGKIDGSAISFAGIQPATPYDLRMALSDGRILHGVNMDWYTAEPARPDAAALDDDDRRQIGALVTDVKSFYDVSRIIAVSGDHDRATVLVERMRSSPIGGAPAGDVIWRVELWYFTNDFGGWSELPQTNKVLMRMQFKNPAEYHATVDPLKWVAGLGGIVLGKSEQRREMLLPADPFRAPAATQP